MSKIYEFRFYMDGIELSVVEFMDDGNYRMRGREAAGVVEVHGAVPTYEGGSPISMMRDIVDDLIKRYDEMEAIGNA